MKIGLKLKQQLRQENIGLIIGFLVVVGVLTFGIFALYRVTIQMMHVQAMQADRLLQSEANALIRQVKDSLRRKPDGELDSLKTRSADVQHSIISRDLGSCLATGSDLTRKYRCRSVEITVALAGSRKASSNDGLLTHTYTVDFQYPASSDFNSG